MRVVTVVPRAGWFVALVTIFCLTPFSFGRQGSDNPDIKNTQAETTPLLTPDEARGAWRVPEGFRVSVFAHEPDVHQPIAMAFDERGRLWVVENYTYSDRKEGFNEELSDRVVILEDTDQDGKFDSRKVFWDKGNKLTGIEFGRGGVFLMGAPEFVFIPDADRDDVPDGPPQVLLDGFNDDTIRHNLVNGLRWGPDGWLYSRHGIQAVSLVGQPGSSRSQRTSMNCCVWRYHPDRQEFEIVTEGGTNPWGFDFDSHGEMYMINTVIGHLYHVIPGARYNRMYGSHFNPYTYQTMEQTADHFHWDRGSENWFKAKDALKEAGRAISDGTDAAGGGHAHCGLMIYQGDNWPAEYRDRLFTLNFHGRRINQERLERQGTGYVGKHESDLFFTDDEWFRGVELGYGPDGTVLVLDWSDIGECHENDGIHRTSGRIFRIAYGKVEKKPAVDLGKLDDAELIEYLKHPNQYFVRTARRVLSDRAAKGELKVLYANLQTMATSGEHKLEAIWTMASLNILPKPSSGTYRSWLSDSDEHVRAWAIRLLTKDDFAAPPVNEQISDLANDESGLVRMYLASSFDRMSTKQKFTAATSLANRDSDANDHVMPHLIWYRIEPDLAANFESAMDLFSVAKNSTLRKNLVQRLVSDPNSGSVALQKIVQRLTMAEQVHRTDIVVGIHRALDGRRKIEKPDGWSDFVSMFLEKSTMDPVRDKIEELDAVFGEGQSLERLEKIVLNLDAEVSRRRQAIVSWSRYADPDRILDLCQKIIGERRLAKEVVSALAMCNKDKAADLILRDFNRFDADGRAAAIDVLTSREPWAMRLLNRIEKGKLDRLEITAWHARQIQNLGSEKLDQKLTAVWGTIRKTDENRAAQIESLQKLLTADRLAEADVANGKVLFEKNCANCHVLFGKGKNIGPDLTGSDRRNVNYLLENIVDPSASVAENFRSSVLAMEDGRVLTGVILNKAGGTIQLQTKDEVLVIDEADVEESRQTELSLMPEQLLDALSDKEKADLFAWLMSGGTK